MTGIGQALAAGGEGGTANPLSASAAIDGGSSSVSVSSASGDTQFNRYFVCYANGGTPPYSFSWRRQNSAEKTALKDSSKVTAYVSWSNMAVGEYSSVTALCRVTDAAGDTVNTNVVVIGITRVS